MPAPHSVIRRKSKREDFAQIARLIAETGAEVLVLGLPKSLNPDAPIGPQARRILKISRALADQVTVPIKLVDESYTTADAAALLRETGKTGKIPIDAAAAALILQAYLDSKVTHNT